MMKTFGKFAAVLIALAPLYSPQDLQARPIKVGVLRTAGGCAAYFIARDKGYFAAEKLETEAIFFDAAQPNAVATVSGDIDVGIAGLSSALYTLAGEGYLKIIAGSNYNTPTFNASTIVASNQAVASGLTTLKNLAGHSVGITQVGSPFHYTLAMLAQKNGVDLKSVRVLPLQSFANISSALTGGPVDLGILVASVATSLTDKGNGKTIPWSVDDEPQQVSVMWIATKTANERADMVRRFLAAYRKGVSDYDAAFVGPGSARKNGPTADATLELLSKDLGQTPDEINRSIAYIDHDARLDLKDIARQIAWYRSQGMLKGDFGVDQVVDRRYAVALPD
jgi:NitT/TauT family transport system substrate-binding protein